jgi:maleate isomerase
MYGWRSRIGLIIPSDNTAMESEFNKILYPVEGVSVLATRIFLEELSHESLLEMREGVKRAARELETAEVDVIAYGCTSGSFIEGLNFDREIISEIEEETGITATTTSTAVVQALTALRVKKIAVGTPYPDDVNEKEKEFFEDSGFEVTHIAGLAITPDVDIGKQEPYVAYNLGKAVDTDDAECIFLSCTDFRTIDMIDALEKRLKKPVISSNQASLWHVMTLQNLGILITGYGTLLNRTR